MQVRSTGEINLSKPKQEKEIRLVVFGNLKSDIKESALARLQVNSAGLDKPSPADTFVVYTSCSLSHPGYM